MNEKILVIDDEDGVRLITSRMLQHAGYRVVAAATAAEALDRFGDDPAGFDAVILDLTMPGMDGADLAIELRRRRGDLKIVVSSGYGEPEALQRLAGGAVAGFLQKPFSAAMLTEAVREVLAAPPPAAG